MADLNLRFDSLREARERLDKLVAHVGLKENKSFAPTEHGSRKVVDNLKQAIGVSGHTFTGAGGTWLVLKGERLDVATACEIIGEPKHARRLRTRR